MFNKFTAALHYRSPKFQIVTYLSLYAIKAILKGLNLKLKRGRRDLALLSVMYDTGARVQELIDLTSGYDRP